MKSQASVLRIYSGLLIVAFGASYLCNKSMMASNFRVDDDVAIDATKKGNLARFINHSCDVYDCATFRHNPCH